MTAPRTLTLHRPWKAISRLFYGQAAWVAGDGPFALLAWCDVLTVSLHETEASARSKMDFLDRTRCGHACHNRHEVVDLREVGRR